MPTISLKKYNLKIINPSLAREWHSLKNGKLKPADVKRNSHKKVWWQCKKGHEWEAVVKDRNLRGDGCPYCSGRYTTKETCLETLNSKLAEEWHPTKNGKLTPASVSANSNKKRWWLCKKEHEWEADVSNRNNGAGCPYCTGRYISKETCLETLNPKLAEEWHPTKNGKLTPSTVHPNSDKKAWWLCKQGHEWDAVVGSRNCGIGCPFCSGRYVTKETCLETVNPSFAKEWHPTKNGKLTLANVHSNSRKKVWWLCKQGHEWETPVGNRNKGSGCPFCSGRYVTKETCLKTVNPSLAKEWHPTKNGKLTPTNVLPNSNIKRWWLCKQGHEWATTINSRHNGTGCPHCCMASSTMELRIFTEIQFIFDNVKHREKKYGAECDIYISDLKFAIEVDGAYWHKDKYEDDLKKTKLLESKGIGVLRLRGKGLRKINQEDIIVNEFQITYFVIEKILSVIQKKKELDKKLVCRLNAYKEHKVFKNQKMYNDMISYLPGPLPGNSLLDKNTELAREWHPTKNGRLKPVNVYPVSHKKVWWLCKQGHEWETPVSGRSYGSGCPYCYKERRGKKKIEMAKQ